MLSIALKARLLDSFAKVEPDTAWGHALNVFCRNAPCKHENELQQLMLDMRSQNKDNPELMRKMLGDQYDFLMTVNIQR